MRWSARTAVAVTTASILAVSLASPALADDVVPADPPVGSTPELPPAVPAAAPLTPAEQSVARLVERRLHDGRIGDDVSLLVLDAHTGAVVAAHRSSVAQQPASNMKLVTAVAALATMGADARLRTTVLDAGPGHLILRGGGDPLLTRGGLDDLARATARAMGGPGRVTVHVDGTLFAPPSDADGWAPRTSAGSVAPVRSLGVLGDRSRRTERNAAERFAAGLRKRGFEVRIGQDRRAAPDAPVIAQTAGHSVADAVAVMLSRSESTVAEVLHRQVAVASGLPATWEGARRATTQALFGLGLDTTGQRLVDGSGLSRADRLTPWFLARLLQVARIEQPERFRAMFRPSAMPVAGRTGTLGTRFGRYASSPSRCAVGRVQAKTGTIPRTIALSGIARTVDGRLRVFSMIVNHRPLRVSELSTRQALDGLAATVTGCWSAG